MSDRLAIKKKVIQFVSEQRGALLDELCEDLELYHDLKLWGDDVEPFFLDFCDEFDFPTDAVDLSGCFPGEGWSFADLFFKPKLRIRIKHLIDAACSKKWPKIENV
jgi:hypothetical protein